MDSGRQQSRKPLKSNGYSVTPAVLHLETDCLAEGEGFEPSVRASVQRFSRAPEGVLVRVGEC